MAGSHLPVYSSSGQSEEVEKKNTDLHLRSPHTVSFKMPHHPLTTCDVTDKEFPTGETPGRLWLISDNMRQGLTGCYITQMHTETLSHFCPALHSICKS